MPARPVTVVDTNVLVHSALPVVDGRERAPSGEDPLRALLTACEVHVPEAVVGELADLRTGDDLLATAAAAVLRASAHCTTHAVDPVEASLPGLDAGEARGIHLANRLDAAIYGTDEMGTPNYLLVAAELADRNTLFTTAQLLCALADRGFLATEYVDAALTYYVDTKGWDRTFVDHLRERQLR